MVHTDTPTQNIILPTQNINSCNGNGHQQLILPSSYSWFVGLSSSPTILLTSSDDVDILVYLPNKRIKQRRRRKKHTRIIIILLLHLLVVFRSLFMAHRLFCCFQACGPLFVVDVGASTYFLFLFDIIQQSTWWQSHNNIHYIEYTTINHG